MQLTNPLIELGERRGLHRGLHEGLQEGRHQGEVELVVRQLGRRLGDLSAQQKKAIRRLPVSKIEALGEALLDFSSPADLARWLRQNAGRAPTSTIGRR